MFLGATFLPNWTGGTKNKFFGGEGGGVNADFRKFEICFSKNRAAKIYFFVNFFRRKFVFWFCVFYFFRAEKFIRRFAPFAWVENYLTGR